MYGVGSDDISYKGILFTKIVIQERVLYLFNTHTQASYFHLTVGDFLATIDARHD
jgi:hypothetical protein